MPVPSVTDFKRIIAEFFGKWDFPNCFGAMDGKHVRLRCPANTGSLYHNYKEYFSMVLLAIVDANYKFITVDVGSYGKEGDSGIFHKSALGQKIASGNFNVPDSDKLPESNMVLPNVLVADEAFGLDTYLMKPFCKNDAKQSRPKAIFNYRLCRARRVTENSFALLSQVFRIFYTPIAVVPEACDNIIMVACCLHNMLRDAYLEKNKQPYYIRNNEDLPVENLLPLARVGGFANAAGFLVRNKFSEYFVTQGQVHWQDEKINRRQ